MSFEWKSNILGILGIVIGLLAFINEEYRLIAALIFSAAVVFYTIQSFSQELEKHETRVQRLEEKLKIHEQLINLKADVEYLKKEVRK